QSRQAPSPRGDRARLADPDLRTSDVLAQPNPGTLGRNGGPRRRCRGGRGNLVQPQPSPSVPVGLSGPPTWPTGPIFPQPSPELSVAERADVTRSSLCTGAPIRALEETGLTA